MLIMPVQSYAYSASPGMAEKGTCATLPPKK